jgi:hypothetical protein
MFNKLICKLLGHQPDKRHGFRNEADYGAVCNRCGYQYETRAEFEDRRSKLRV